MATERHLIIQPWADYELIDSGENMKLERFGSVVVARPETQALWKKARPERWGEASAIFQFHGAKGGWEIRKPLPKSWELSWNGARFLAKLTGFKHTGVFPEQAPNWEWLQERVTRQLHGGITKPNILNLFGYTGIASVVAALAAKTAPSGLSDGSPSESCRGAFVTHVDASKQSLDWARENARLSGLPEDAVRWICEDALAFARRAARRAQKYDGIILDPPAFGRGAKGEVWRIEEDLPPLIETLKDLLADAPSSFFLMNGYAAGYAPVSFLQTAESAFGARDAEYGELHIKESGSARVVPAGMYVRFAR